MFQTDLLTSKNLNIKWIKNNKATHPNHSKRSYLHPQSQSNNLLK